MCSVVPASGVGRSPCVRVHGALEGSGSVPTIGVPELVVCHHNGVDQVEELRWVRAVKASLVRGLGDGRSLAGDEGL